MLTTTAVVVRTMTLVLRTTTPVPGAMALVMGTTALGGIGYFLLCTGSESPELLVISKFYITRQRYSVYWWGYMFRLHTGVGQKT